MFVTILLGCLTVSEYPVECVTQEFQPFLVEGQFKESGQGLRPMDEKFDQKSLVGAPAPTSLDFN